MLRNEVLNHIKEEWKNNPLIGVSDNVSTMPEGIKQQLDNGNFIILYMAMDNNTAIMKTIKVKD